MLLTLEQARTALVTTSQAVKLMDENGVTVRLTSDPHEVIALLVEGLHQFGGSKSRVKWIKVKGPVPEPRQAPLPEPVVVALAGRHSALTIRERLVPYTFRTDEAAVFPPWPQYRDGVFGLRAGQGKLVDAVA